MDMEEAGKSSQLGRVKFMGFESNQLSAYFFSTSLLDWHLVPDCQAGQVIAEVLPLNWVTSSSPIWTTVEEGPHNMSWRIPTCQLTHSNRILFPLFITLFQIGTSVKMITYTTLTSVIYPTLPVFSLGKVISFHRRTQQGFW